MERNGHFPDPEALMGMVAHAEAKIVRLIGPPKSCNHFFLHLRSTLVSKRLEGVSIDTVSDVLDECLQQTEMALVEGGTMVGTIAAQSVGEPATQMSASYDTDVIVEVDGEVKRVPIGPLVDSILNSPSRESLEAPVAFLKCVGVTDRESVQWTNVTHVSRHPANGRILTVTTKRQRVVKMTASHSFLVRRNNRVVALPGHDLVVGDALPVVKEAVRRRLGLAPFMGETAATEGFCIPGMERIISGISNHVSGVPELLKDGPTLNALQGVLTRAKACGAPTELLEELNQAICADVWWDPVESIEGALSDELVYDFTVNQNLQSFMLGNGVFVHNTLNSVEYDTGLVLRWRKAPAGLRNACIGETIDTLLDVYAKKVQTPEARTSYLPLEPGAAEALTVDDEGRVSWKALEAVTRHPPINKDGSPTLLKVTTKSGRTVTATKAKSFLVVRAGEVVPLEGDKLCVGDKLPLVATLPETMIGHICLDAYLDPKRYIFTTVMRKALEKMEQTPKRKPWYSEFYPHLPYSRSDACREALEKRPYLAIPGFVYTKMHNRSTQPLPEVITLNRSFGFFIGAYLAEGCSTDHQIHIANNDARYRMNAATWPSSLGIRHHITNEKDRIKNNGTSISIMFHSSLLAKLVKQWCDCGSWNKRVPDFAYSAPDEFVRGLLDAYISGDGSVALNGSITASSRSLALIEGISLLLRRFCISSSIGKTNVNDAPQHSLYITISDAKIFQQHISLCISEKDCRISCSNPKYRCSNGKILNDVLEDPVVSIEEVVSPHEFVYDLTVAETRNMVTLSGLGTRDTFHSAGTGNRTVMSGVPRFKELIDCTKNPKAPSMTIFLNDDLAASKGAVQQMAHGMRKVLLAECVTEPPTVHHRTDNVPEDEGMVERFRIVRGLGPRQTVRLLRPGQGGPGAPGGAQHWPARTSCRPSGRPWTRRASSWPPSPARPSTPCRSTSSRRPPFEKASTGPRRRRSPPGSNATSSTTWWTSSSRPPGSPASRTSRTRSW